MDDENENKVNPSRLLDRTLEQLYNLKKSLAEVDDLDVHLKKVSLNETDEIIYDLTNKVRDLIKNAKSSLETIDTNFNRKYTIYKKQYKKRSVKHKDKKKSSKVKDKEGNAKVQSDTATSSNKKGNSAKKKVVTSDEPSASDDSDDDTNNRQSDGGVSPRDDDTESEGEDGNAANPSLTEDTDKAPAADDNEDKQNEVDNIDEASQSKVDENIDKPHDKEKEVATANGDNASDIDINPPNVSGDDDTDKDPPQRAKDATKEIPIMEDANEKATNKQITTTEDANEIDDTDKDAPQKATDANKEVPTTEDDEITTNNTEDANEIDANKENPTTKDVESSLTKDADTNPVAEDANETPAMENTNEEDKTPTTDSDTNDVIDKDKSTKRAKTKKDKSTRDKDSIETNGQADIKLENGEDNPPKLGIIKCIDITKLLDPNIVNKRPARKINTNDSIIVLNSSDSDEPMQTAKRGEQKRTAGNKTVSVTNRIKIPRKSVDKRKNRSGSSEVELLNRNVLKKVKQSQSLTKKDKSRPNNKADDPISLDSDSSSKTNENAESRVNNVSGSDSDSIRMSRRATRKNDTRRRNSSSSDDSVRARRSRMRPKRQTAIKKRSKYVISSSSSSKSESDSSSESSDPIPPPKSKKSSKITWTKFELPKDYDYKADNKFKSECRVQLDKVPVEKLREKYLEEKEIDDVNRLTNLKSVKKSRRGKMSSSSSEDAATKRAKPRSKRAKMAAASGSDEEVKRLSRESTPEDASPMNADSTVPEEVVPEGFASSNDEVANDSDTDKVTKKKKKDCDKAEKNGTLENGDVLDDSLTNSKSDDDKSNNDKDKSDEDSDGDGKKKKKKPWSSDPLLRTKLNESDSEEELLRMKKKKSKLDDAKNKKSKKKRKARTLGSDSEQSAQSEDYVKSESSDSESEVEESSKKKTVRKRIKNIRDSEVSSEETAEKKEEDTPQATRKKIRGVWNRESLAETTKAAAKEEEERKKRIADRQKLYNEMYDAQINKNTTVDKVVLDFNEETKQELLSVHPDLVSKLKPHQAKGIQFMWTACFESLERAKKTEGSGCILAHCMGLGKTLQVICLIHTLITHSEQTGVRTVLVVCPVSTVLNWVNEFKKWLDDIDGEEINVFDLVSHKQNYERMYQMKDWQKCGGVLMIGYDMFRNLSNPKGKRLSKKMATGFASCLLDPGPDLVICDEGHLLKNEKTGISIAMNRLKTQRRIVLTGTPLQNNLKEYFCMVQFVKPNLLGTYKEYLNRFVNPITNGQYTDSTDLDIQIMRKRSHVLHKMLDGIVERRDYCVLAPFLPPKHEYVLFITLSKVQIDLYREYLDKFSRSNSSKGTSYLFNDFQELQRICIHPRVLLDKSNKDRIRKEAEDDDSEGSLKDFIDDGESDATSTPEESNSEENSASEPVKRSRRTRANPGNISEEELPAELPMESDEWWSKFCRGDELDNINHSHKIHLLLEILHQSELIGDKVLVFSQSLFSLNLIEYFLSKIDDATQADKKSELLGNYTGTWHLGLDYFRLDGSTSCENRALWCKHFNSESNTRARLFLISTRAGGLGINLVAANRVIIFDVSWNPSHDIQSIYRVYRFGQTKPCYVYRFVTLGTMENKIYERQVTKQAISKRVIDEQQIDRHYNQNDLAELYAFNPVPDEERPIPMVPKDRLFADLLQLFDGQIYKYHEHNSLLENKEDETLNEEERKAAWEEFENEKKAPKFNMMTMMVRNGMYETLRSIVQKDNSTWTSAQVNNVLPSVVQKISDQMAIGDYSMYRRIAEEHERRIMEQKRVQMQFQQYMQQIAAAQNPNLLPMMTPSNIAHMLTQMGAGQGLPFQPPSASMQPAAPTPPTISEIVELND